MDIDKQIIHRSFELFRKFAVCIALLFMVFCICGMSPLSIFHGSGISSTDSSVFRYFGWQIADGAIPYRDMFDHKGPLLYLINFFGYILSENYGIWVIELLFACGYVGISYLIARMFVRRLPSLLIVVLAYCLMSVCFQGGNLTEEYALFFQFVSLYYFLQYFKNRDAFDRGTFKQSIINVKVIVCGMCFGAVLLLRPNLIAVWIIYCVAIAYKCILNKELKQLGGFCVAFFIGVLIVFIPCCAYLILNGAFSAFLNDYLFFNMYYMKNLQTSVIMRFESIWAFFNLSTVVFCFVTICLKMYICKGKQRFMALLAFFFLLLSLFFVGLSGESYMHYGMSLIPAVLVSLAEMFETCKKNELIAVRYIMCVYLMLTFLLPVLPGMIAKTFLGGSQNNQEKTTEVVQTENAVVDQIVLHTNPDDTIAVYRNHNYYYLASHRKSAASYSYLPPKVTDEMRLTYFAELEEAAPKLVIAKNNDIDEYLTSFINDNGYEQLYKEDGVVIYQVS